MFKDVSLWTYMNKCEARWIVFNPKWASLVQVRMGYIGFPIKQTQKKEIHSIADLGMTQLLPKEFCYHTPPEITCNSTS